MKRNKLRISIITAALAMMIAGGVLTWKQDSMQTEEGQKNTELSAQTETQEKTGNIPVDEGTENAEDTETSGGAEGEIVREEAGTEMLQEEAAYNTETACEEELPVSDETKNEDLTAGADSAGEAENNPAVENQQTAEEETKNQETAANIEAGDPAVETAGERVNTPQFTEETVMELPVAGSVLIPYNMENTVYFSTLDLYQCNPGVVFSAEEGTPVFAAAAGEVTSVENTARTGLTVTMNLGNGYEAIYGQLAEVSLQAGQKVEAAARIGTVAAPTRYFLEEGSNLFFEMKKDGVAVDPMEYLPPVAE